MCGFSGFSNALVYGSDKINRKTENEKYNNILLSSRNLIAHRGPDSAGIFYQPTAGVGLVHTRLSILDLTAQGHQPMVSNDGQVVIVFNGEIYNFQELRSELEKDGVQFSSTSDTEVLLHLYLTSGHKFSTMLRRLNGVFSFVIWDARCRKLFIARDAFGVKPLYIYEQDGCIAFASELKALIPFMKEHANWDDLDVDALFRYSTYLWCPGKGTPLKAVRKLGPGELLEVQEGRIVFHETWYKLPIFHGIKPTLSKVHAVKGTFEHLRNAVHRQLVSDVPVGAFLSGGLDSSSIVALAKEQHPDIQCFTIQTAGGNAEGFSDDLPYAHKVAAHLNVSLEVVTVDSTHMAASLETMVAQLDEPLADPAPLNAFFICQMAREQGIKVLLSGAGGDDLFTGYRRHYALSTEEWMRWMPKFSKLYLQHIASRLDKRVPVFRRLAKFFDAAVLDGDDRITHYFSWIRRSDLVALYSPDLRNRIESVRPDSTMLQYLSDVPPESSLLQRMLSLDQRFFLTDHNLMYTDKMSMAVGVEVRVPFLDLELVDFSARIPDRYKQRGSIGKWVLKKAMEGYLPKDVIYRPKSGFGAPLRRWIRFELRELLGDLLSIESLRNRGIFDPIAVQKLIKSNDAGVIDASYTLLSLMCIEIWCRQFLDGQFNYQRVYGSNQ